MKKSELKQIIREVLLKEEKFQEYDFQNLGGGWDGYVSVDDFKQKEILINLGLYSGGRGNTIKVATGPETTKHIENKYSKNHDEAKAADKYFYNIKKNISSDFIKLLKKFDGDVGILIKKYNKEYQK